MPHTRRGLFHAAGLFLAAALARNWAPGIAGEAPAPRGERWAALRQCWLELARARAQPESLAGPTPQQQEAAAALARRHQEVLDALVAAGELEAAAAGDIAVALGQVLEHRERSMALCYIAFPSEFMPRLDLERQLALLNELAARSAIDPAAVEQARAALERDIAWLSEFQAGRVPGAVDSLQELDPASREAARILVALLLGG